MTVHMVQKSAGTRNKRKCDVFNAKKWTHSGVRGDRAMSAVELMLFMVGKYGKEMPLA